MVEAAPPELDGDVLLVRAAGAYFLMNLSERLHHPLHLLAFYLQAVAQALQSPADVLHARLVCRQWAQAMQPAVSHTTWRLSSNPSRDKAALKASRSAFPECASVAIRFPAQQVRRGNLGWDLEATSACMAGPWMYPMWVTSPGPPPRSGPLPHPRPCGLPIGAGTPV